MGVALGLAVTERETVAARLTIARDRLIAALTAIDGVELSGHPTERLPGLVSVIARDVEGASVVLKLDLEDVAASVGSACTTGSAEPSHVLRALGYPDEEARGSLRVSLGRDTTDDDVDVALEIVPRTLLAAREGARRVAASRTPLGTGVGI